MNGFELCRRLRSEALTQNTPIVLVTAKVFDKDIAAGVELGIDDYIVKPFSIADVLGRVSSLLQARQTQQAQIKAN
jgi:DNA-binding response OmpR family regulator